MKQKKTIFVSIASYRDQQLIPTIFSLIDEANHPERVNVVVCWQDNNEVAVFEKAGFILQEIFRDEEQHHYLFNYKNATIDIHPIDYHKSKGAGWARHFVDQYYQQQDYLLQIDSHSRVIKGWDDEMIAMLESLRDQSEFPVLSTYPPPFTPASGEKIEERASHISRLVFNHFNNDGVPGFKATDMKEPTPRRCGFLAAGFVFADGHFVTNVPNDPDIFFLGEEICVAARAYTHGYDIYTPSKLLLWHFYGREDHPKIWGDHSNEAKDAGEIEAAWWEHDAQSKQKIAFLLGQSEVAKDLGMCTFGTKRSLQEFQYRVGLDFKLRQVHPDALPPLQITWFETLPIDHATWIESIKQVFDKKFTLAKSELKIDDNSVTWWHIGVYDLDNAPIMRRRLSPAEFKDELKELNDTEYEIQIQFRTANNHTAQTLRFCPWFSDGSWGDVVEKAW